MYNDRRIVVTGIGLITPLGIDVESSWKNLISGYSGIKTISEFNTSLLSCKIAGLVPNFDPLVYLEPKEVRKVDLFIQYGIAAATQAILDSNWLPEDEYLKERTGIIIGSGIGGLKMIENTAVTFSAANSGKVTPFFIPSSLINLVAGQISIKYGFTGPNLAVATACTTGTHAIGEAARMIKCGDADVMIAGGAEAAITPLSIAGFSSAKALSINYNHCPEQASRPWDINRDGFVMGEGAGIVILEEYNHAINRGAKIYGEVIGYGLSGDAYHITSTHPEGRGAYKAMEKAIYNANIKPSDIDYINAHGTSTPLGDAVELHAVQKLFYDTNPGILMSSTKSSTGHLLGAAGSVELIFSLLAMRDQIVPPTLNLVEPIPEAKINLVPLKAKEAKLNYILSNSFGFGGTNGSLVIKKI